MNPQREKMDGGSSWWSCGECGAMWETRDDAKNCCTDVSTKGGV